MWEIRTRIQRNTPKCSFPATEGAASILLMCWALNLGACRRTGSLKGEGVHWQGGGWGTWQRRGTLQRRRP